LAPGIIRFEKVVAAIRSDRPPPPSVTGDTSLGSTWGTFHYSGLQQWIPFSPGQGKIMEGTIDE